MGNASRATAAPPALRRTPSCKTIDVRSTLTMWTRKETAEDEASGLNLRLAVNVANRLNAISTPVALKTMTTPYYLLILLHALLLREKEEGGKNRKKNNNKQTRSRTLSDLRSRTTSRCMTAA